MTTTVDDGIKRVTFEELSKDKLISMLRDCASALSLLYSVTSCLLDGRPISVNHLENFYDYMHAMINECGFEGALIATMLDELSDGCIPAEAMDSD